ncbi:MAG: hypothetical protein IT207_01670 [Fimbriimonadaceae bacterium]|nr:hypothetical protein [Fimbriimonadaceae bacterium]
MATVRKYGTVADMKSDYANIGNGDHCIVQGYYAPDDGGGGIWRKVSASTAPPNDGSVLGVWATDPPAFIAGRLLLLHNGFLTTRQFGAPGATTTLAAQTGPGLRFASLAHVKATYSGGHGEAFNGLKDADTADWAAIQAVLNWCGENGVRLEGSSGEFFLRRPLWLGDDDVDYDQPEGEDKFKDHNQQGLTFVGQTGNSRRETDGQACNLRLTSDCSNRYCLPSNVGTVDTDTFRLVLPGAVGGGTTADIDVTEQHATVVAAIETALGSNPYSVVYLGDDTTDTIDEVNCYFRIVHDTSASPAFLGPITPIQGAPSTDPTYVVRCLPDSGIVSFRRSAGLYYRLEGLSLKGNDEATNPPAGQPGVRNASFGVLFATSQFVGHVVERVNVAFPDTVLGVLEGTGVNGEDLYLARLKSENCRRGYYSDAPQSFGHDLVSSTLSLDSGGVMLEFAQAPSPGYGFTAFGLEGTFENDDAEGVFGHGTLVKVRRGTGTVQLVGGRVEHCTTVLDYDAVDGQGARNNLDLTLRGTEFDGMRGGTLGALVKGSDQGGTPGTDYGLYVQDCKLKCKDGVAAEHASLRFESVPKGGLRAVFERCRFIGWRDFASNGWRGGFQGCCRNDYTTPGATSAEGPLRQFSSESGAPKARTQSVRTVFQDTPWASRASASSSTARRSTGRPSRPRSANCSPAGGRT